MSHYWRDVTDPCHCAQMTDASWFLEHPDRRKYIRIPFECELAKMTDSERAVTTQLVCIYMEASIQEQERDPKVKVILVAPKRRSFLMAGALTDWKCDSDQDVDRLLLFIDDSKDMVPTATVQ